MTDPTAHLPNWHRRSCPPFCRSRLADAVATALQCWGDYLPGADPDHEQHREPERCSPWAALLGEPVHVAGKDWQQRRVHKMVVPEDAVQLDDDYPAYFGRVRLEKRSRRTLPTDGLGRQRRDRQPEPVVPMAAPLNWKPATKPNPSEGGDAL